MGMEAGDIADFEPVLDGQMSLRELRTAGICTTVVKKVKTKKRSIPQGPDKEPIEEVEREIELHDRSGREFDRVLDRTDGKANQTISSPEGGGVNLTVKVMKVEFDK